MQRRDFLKLGAGAAAMGLVGCSSEEAAPPTDAATTAAPWGTPRPDQRQALLPAAAIPDGMMEIFLVGGLGPWETFYTVPEHGRPGRGGDFEGQQWWAFQDQGTLSVPQLFSKCGGGDRPLLEPWTTDSAGRMVNLGPFVWPLRDRPDMLARMRVWVMQHGEEPHENAIPYAICGHRLGNPRMAALGAHLQRFHMERGPTTRGAPYSYTIYQDSLSLDGNGGAASEVGLHRASARPLDIRLGADLRLPEQLARPGVAGFRGDLDVLVRHYANRARARLGGVRAPGLADFTHARTALEQHDALAALLTAQALASQDIKVCVPDPLSLTPSDVVLDQTTTGISLGAHLLTAPENTARYVQVMESGLYTDPAGQGYDSHAHHVQQQGPNVIHMLKGLSRVVNRPGEGDPRKLDMDRHFILLNTEFGRSPFPEVTIRNPGGLGTNHWPWGYVVIGFGGFVDADRAGLVGSIGEDGYARSGFTPDEHRAAMLLAMGAWPFSAESFAVGDIRDVQTELDAAMKLREQVLGYPA